ncbi:hypothetical protein [Streptomyces sp. cg40]|uniref:hypothetical protein n=1 Tax=Streptomyces sp. cg40 TaxID=3419764 RepID=UPI003D012DDE
MRAGSVADPDPWHGPAAGPEKVCELQAHDRGLREVMLGTGKAARRRALVDRPIKPLVDPLIDRAEEQRAPRPDVEPLDLPMIQLMVAAVTDQTGEPDLWRRYLRMLLDGMRTRPDGTEPLPPGRKSHPL